MCKINDKLTVISQFRGMFTDKLFANIHNLFTVSAVIFSPFAQLVPHLCKQTRLLFFFYSVTVHLRLGRKVEIQCVRVEQKLQWQCNCVLCAAGHVFCTMTQLWLKLKLWSNMLPALLCMELGRNRSRCTTNGITEYKTANTDQNIGVNVFL